MFGKYTKSAICWEYKRKFRYSGNDPSLPAPFRILLAGKELSVYSLAGSTVVKIRKYKNVYFHVQKVRVKRAYSDIFASQALVDDAISKEITDVYQNKTKR